MRYYMRQKLFLMMKNRSLSPALSKGEGAMVFNFLRRISQSVVVFIVCCTVLLSQPASLKAQTIEETFIYANEQHQAQQYENAINAYQRVLFFDKKSASRVYYNLAESYYQLSKYDQAAKYYDLAYSATSNDSLKYLMLFSKTTCLLLQHSYNAALAELFSLDDSLQNYWQQKKYFYFGVTYFGMANFNDAKTYFIKAGLPEQNAEIEQLFVQIKKVNRLNPKTAQILSIILPGLGQIYSGDIKNGINSFVLTAGFMTLALYTAYNYTVVEAILSVLPWYQRYYMGGFKNAKMIAQRKKEQRQNEIFQELMNVFANVQVSR